MSQLHKLDKIVDKSRKTVGRGRSSDVGKTSRRGHKGQRARNKVRRGFEGGQSRLIKRIPFYRGAGFTGRGVTYQIVNVGQLAESYKAGERVTHKSLLTKGLIRKSPKQIKILGRGKGKKKLLFGHGFMFTDKAREKLGLEKSVE